ncbi:MAG: SGNH/GDSL hydrolase family protein [Clostridia bacterium]|nr:SGNH/GDSL hydrolase family protein [Clostridia bacterium]
MEIKGLKINCLGDSITRGAAATEDALCYVGQLQHTFGANARNYGIGGTRIAVQRHKKCESAVDFSDFSTRAPWMDPDVDLIFVFGGTNDFGHGDAPFGYPQDRTPNTYYGALHVLIITLKACYPHAKLVFATPLDRATGNKLRDDGQGGQVSLKDYVCALEEVCAFYGVPVLDLYRDNGDPRFTHLYDGSLLSDGLHPNNEGHALLAARIAAFIEEML